MVRAEIAKIAAKMNRAGVPGNYSQKMSRLISRIWKELAKGEPISPTRADEIIKELGIPVAEGRAFLRNKAERDPSCNILGILGLSQDTKWAHRLTVNGVTVRTWCAWDPLFLVQCLGENGLINSACAVTKQPVEIFAGPKGVKSYSPPTAVVSIVTLDPDRQDKRKLEELWSGL